MGKLAGTIVWTGNNVAAEKDSFSSAPVISIIEVLARDRARAEDGV